MVTTVDDPSPEKTRILLGLLESVEQDGTKTQRRLAAELGIALGLANAYLKRCVNKGLIKVQDAPAQRYAYYLTPRGFAEKSRLTVEYLSVSFSLFRKAKTEYIDVFASLRGRDIDRIALLGASDLAEVASICALDSGLALTCVVDNASTLERFAGLPVVKSLADLEDGVQGAVVTDLRVPRTVLDAAVARFGVENVQAPRLLGLNIGGRNRATR